MKDANATEGADPTKGPACPRCGKETVAALAPRWRYQCSACSMLFSDLPAAADRDAVIAEQIAALSGHFEGGRGVALATLAAWGLEALRNEALLRGDLRHIRDRFRSDVEALETRLGERL
jgi:ribosomal protein S27AE